MIKQLRFVIQIIILKISGNKGWSGNYSSWQEARSKCDGYNKSEILDKCLKSLLMIKNGDAVYERDSVLFNEVQYNWQLLASLLRAALENNGNLCVIDFGGSLGSSYYQNKTFLKGIKNLTWCIVEQPNFVECGKEHFESESLKFFYSIEECVAKYQPSIVILSSVLQYLEKPFDVIAKLQTINCKYIVLDRTMVSQDTNDMLTIQRVPKAIYDASYPSWIFSENNLLNKFDEYVCTIKFISEVSGPIIVNNKLVKWKGYVFEKKVNNATRINNLESNNLKY